MRHYVDECVNGLTETVELEMLAFFGRCFPATKLTPNGSQKKSAMMNVQRRTRLSAQ